MHLKRKYQVGGIAYTPYLPAQAGSPKESTSNSGSGSQPDKLSGMKKEIVDLLKENGLPSDVSVLLNSANVFLTKSRALSGKTLFGGTDDDYDLSDLIKVQQLVNDVKYNNNLRDKAVAQLTKESAGSEVAVTDTGYIYAQNKNGGIEKITPGEYSKKSDEYIPLTNNQLLYYREHENGLAFNTGILNDLQNTIGMNSIIKYLRDTIQAFGKDTVEGYTTKDTEVNEGLKSLMAAGPDGFYTFKTEDERRNVNKALRYLYNGMSENAKNLLRAKTAVEGGDASDPDDISNLLLQALYEHTSVGTSVKFDKPATEYDPLGTKKKGGSANQLTTDTYPEALVSGSGLNPAKYVNIMPEDTGVVLHTYAQDAGPVLRNKDDRMNVTNLQVVLTNGYGIGGVTDAQSVTFGDQLINPAEYNKLMVDSFVNMKRAWLPFRYAPDGRITPNFEAQQKLEQVQDYIAQQNGAVSDAWIINWLEQNLPEAIWNPETKQVEFNQNYIAPFLVLHGIAGRNRLNFDTNSKYLHHLSNDEGLRWKDEYERIVGEQSLGGNVNRDKSEKGSARWRYYSGNIFIPISGPTTGSLIYNHQYFPKSTYMDITQQATANQEKQQLKTNF